MNLRSRVRFGAVLLIALASACALGACSTGDEAPPPPTAGGNGEALQETDPVTGTTDFYMPHDKEQALRLGGDAAQAALDYLQKNGAQLDIPDARASYRPIGTIQDAEDGSMHVKLQQMSNGIDVWGVVTTVHFDENGFVDIVDGPHIPNLDAITKQVPAIGDAGGKAGAEAEARAVYPTATMVAVVGPSTLEVFVEEDYSAPRLARHYLVSVMTDTTADTLDVFIDAMTGVVIESTTKSGGAEQRETKALGLDGQEYTTPIIEQDSSHFQHGRLRTTQKGGILSGRWVYNTAGDSWFNIIDHATVDGPWDQHAVLALGQVERTERFYLDTFNWRGADGAGSDLRIAIKDTSVPYVDGWASWSTIYNGTIVDNLTFTHGVPEIGRKSPVLAIDFVAHEWTHVVTSYNAKLVYGRQPGAINEALSDIFGAMVERHFKGDKVDEGTFIFGDELGMRPLRNILHPEALNPKFALPVTEGCKPACGENEACVADVTIGGAPACFSMKYCRDCKDNYKTRNKLKPGEKLDPHTNDSGFVHTNSTIVSNAWVIMTVGGANDTSGQSVANGLGWDKSAKLWWKTQRFILGPRATIPRLARFQTAYSILKRNLYDPEMVGCAWLAVGALRPSFVQGSLALTCAGAPAPKASKYTSLCADKKDGTYCNEEDDFLGYICKNHEIARPLVCPPPHTKCTGPSSDGKAIVCAD